MIKKIWYFIKKIIISAFILYGYNLIAAPLNIIIPINIFTVLLISFLGIPALLSLIVIFLLIY